MWQQWSVIRQCGLQAKARGVFDQAYATTNVGSAPLRKQPPVWIAWKRHALRRRPDLPAQSDGVGRSTSDLVAGALPWWSPRQMPLMPSAVTMAMSKNGRCDPPEAAVDRSRCVVRSDPFCESGVLVFSNRAISLGSAKTVAFPRTRALRSGVAMSKRFAGWTGPAIRGRIVLRLETRPRCDTEIVILSMIAGTTTDQTDLCNRQRDIEHRLSRRPNLQRRRYHL